MKNWKSLLIVAAVLCFASSAFANNYVGVFFDEEATQSSATLNGGASQMHTAYICATNCEMSVGGAAFKLDVDPRILVVGAVFPPSVEIGTLFEGIEIGFMDPIIAVMGQPAILCTMTLYTGTQLMEDAELTVSEHPLYDRVQVARSDGPVFNYTGMTSYLSVPVGSEDSSWGGVKTLYR